MLVGSKGLEDEQVLLECDLSLLQRLGAQRVANGDAILLVGVELKVLLLPSLLDFTEHRLDLGLLHSLFANFGDDLLILG